MWGICRYDERWMSGRGERLRLSAAAAVVALIALATAAAAVAAGPREKATGLTGSSQWASAGYAISGTVEGGLGRGTYSGALTVAGASFTSATCGPVCAAVSGSITFSTRAGGLTASVQRGSVVSMEEIASHSFRDFQQRGATRVGLGVDGENTTGAVRLYEQVGMRQVRRNDT